MSDPVGRPPELAWLPTDTLDVDPSYQRALDAPASQKLIARIAENFSWMRFQAILATPGEPGRWLIIDGQHRAAAARLRQIAHLPAVVIAEANQAEQAAAFVGANKDRVPVSAQALFHARLAAGDPDAATIARLCNAAGIAVEKHNKAAKQVGAGRTAAVPALLQVLRRYGEETAAEAFGALGECFGRYHAGLRSPFFLAAARFLAEGGGSAGLRLALTRCKPEGLEEAGARLTGGSRIPAMVAALRAAIAARPLALAPPIAAVAPLKTGPLPPKRGGFQDDPRAKADHGSRDAISREAVFGRSVTGSSL